MSNANKTACQTNLASKAGKLALLENARKDFFSKALLINDREAFAVWKPRNNINVVLIAQNFHELRFGCVDRDR